jgi:hypothetical protein
MDRPPLPDSFSDLAETSTHRQSSSFSSAKSIITPVDKQISVMAAEWPTKKAFSGDSTGDRIRKGSQPHYPRFSVIGPQAATSAAQTTGGDTDRKERSCESCRQRKIKCDRGNPCGQCTSSFHGMGALFMAKMKFETDLVRLPLLEAY